MNLRTKWIFCCLIFVSLLGTMAWLNYIVPEDRPSPSRAHKPRVSDEGLRSYNEPETGYSEWLPLLYGPREYVKIVKREH